ncbi:MAG TPA: site-specific DNA-methyltransferase [Bacteroidota bacterium]|nr:site-specific DNA-methyltransferase [Bacteroidota bacterium]
MPSAEQLRSRLLKKLSELFQLDQPDLDFGFYRIMHAKAQEVQDFIGTDLLNIVADAFGDVDEARKAELKARIDKEIAAAKEYGVADPEHSPKVKEARAAYDAAKDTVSAEADVYDHLYRFFERYYDDGDFISRRYYTRETSGKAAPFAVPYNGEEVKLHWANADQYYIKSAEYFSNFTFDLTQSAEVRKMSKEERVLNQIPDSPLKVHFRVVDATEGEHGNVKASETNKRFFILHAGNPVALTETGELLVNFEYRPDPEKTGQEGAWRDKRNAEAVETILERLQAMAAAGGEHEKQIAEYLRLFKVPAPTESDKKRPVLAKYVNQYTARNTMDYFIHKDLGGFLRRELDFYIKNEVMRLDDIENADAPAVESYLARIKVLRKIAGKLIDFLAQLEDFQKKLWLKKKFIIETNYCITLDRIDPSLLPEIAANREQWAEWRTLGFVEEETIEEAAKKQLEVRTKELEGKPADLFAKGSGVSTPLDSSPNSYLLDSKFLVLDTRFFDDSFKARLVASIENFDEQCDGILIHSENFQALNLLQERFGGELKFCYIDPPYNTGGDGFFYKDSYRHSSWLSMIQDRLHLFSNLLRNDGVIYSSIDATERNMLELTLKNTMGESNRVEEIIWAQNTTKNQSPTFSTNHEYVEVYAKDINVVKNEYSMFREAKPGFSEIMELVNMLNPRYPSIHEVETAVRNLFKERKKTLREQGISKEDDEWKSLYNYNRAEYRDADGKLVEENISKEVGAKIWIWREVDTSMPQVKEDSQKQEFRDPDSPTYRFYRPVHPITKKHCSSPKTGWRWPYAAHGKQKNNFCKLAEDHRIVWGIDETKIPQQKSFLHEVETNVAKSVVNDYADGEKELANLFGKSRSFSNPKPSSLIKRFCLQACAHNHYIMDFFVGSGTTGHAAINLNREFGGKRKYILVEIGDYFDTVLKPRIAKVVYSESWKDGKPTARNTGISHCFKYLRLESYEDTLNNLRLDHNPQRKKAVAANPALKEDYMLRYLLDVETRGSQSLLNIDAFADPTAYTLDVKKPGTDEYATRAVDLIETFNYLIGLRVLHYGVPQEFTARFKRIEDPEVPKDQKTKLVLDGKLQHIRALASSPEAKTWCIRKVEGWVPRDAANPNPAKAEQREKVLIVWRKLTGDIEQDNLMLDEWFQKNRISTRDFEFDTIYVNGSNNLPNLKLDNENWKVRLIEEEFMKRMWEVQA